MKLIYSLSLFLFVSNLQAEVAPEHVETMLQQMVKENVISAPEAEKAKIRMRSMTPDQWAMLNKQAAQVGNRMPASVVASSNKIAEVHTVDLDGEQFKAIESEVKKIVPQYQD